jgi:hypothetical protein
LIYQSTYEEHQNSTSECGWRAGGESRLESERCPTIK